MRWFAQWSNVFGSGVVFCRPVSVGGHVLGDGGKSGPIRNPKVVRVMRRCHKPDRQPIVEDGFRHEVPVPGLLRPASPRQARQTRYSMPKEFPCHPPPPSTSYPFRVWFFQHWRPFFCWSKTAIHEDFFPVEQSLFIKSIQKRMPDFNQYSRVDPLVKSSPASAWRRKPLWQILPSGTTAQNPQDSLKARSIIGSRTTSQGTASYFWNEWFNQFPLTIRQQHFVCSGHLGLLSKCN